jgi:hypothetical protein
MLHKVLCLIACALAGALQAAEIELDFNEFKLNERPAGFRSTVSGTGDPGDWKIILDEVPPLVAPFTPNPSGLTRRPVLAQLKQNPADEHFPLLIYEKGSFGDFTLSTRFKTVAGTLEQMAGIVFRFQDEKNYYYVRASSLGNTFRFYKIVSGQRSAPVGREIAIPKGLWHELSITCKGNQLSCMLNGKEVLPLFTDDSFTFGKIGFWTKSDSISYFAETRITYVPREIFVQTVVNEILRQYPRLLDLKVYSMAEPSKVKIVASRDVKEIGQPGRRIEQDAIERNVSYYGKEKDSVLVTLPLHDRNGESIAAVRLTMKSFLGQTEQNALARALPIIKRMEQRISSAKDLLE